MEHDLKVIQTTNALYRHGDRDFISFLKQVQRAEASYREVQFLFDEAKSELESLGIEWKCHASHDVSGHSEPARRACIMITNLIEQYDKLLHAFGKQCGRLTIALQTYIKNRTDIKEEYHSLRQSKKSDSFSRPWPRQRHL